MMLVILWPFQLVASHQICVKLYLNVRRKRERKREKTERNFQSSFNVQYFWNWSMKSDDHFCFPLDLYYCIKMVSFQSWYDYKLRWEPKEYGGVSMLHVPSDHIWRPDIVVREIIDPTSFFFWMCSYNFTCFLFALFSHLFHIITVTSIHRTTYIYSCTTSKYDTHTYQNPIQPYTFLFVLLLFNIAIDGLSRFQSIFCSWKNESDVYPLFDRVKWITIE